MTQIFLPTSDVFFSKVAKDHYNNYKKIIELGDCSATDIEFSPYLLSEKDDWNKTISPNTMPKYLCDKYKMKYYFSEVGWPTLETRWLDHINVFDYFSNKPCILKPLNSGGSISRLKMAYTIFENSKKLLECENNLDFWNSVCDRKNFIIQKAISSVNESYGQLHMEAVINPNGEVHFSSEHEVEFINGRWTKQLKQNLSDIPQLEKIKQLIRDLVKLHSIKGCVISLQHLRNFEEGIWYPTDWQYRFSYNTAWGRSYFEPNYVGELIKFMVGKVDYVTEISNLNYYQKYINVKIKDKTKLILLMDKYNVAYIPVYNNTGDGKFLFISSNNSFEEAETCMLNFEMEVNDV